MSEETISPQEEKGMVDTVHAESNENNSQSSGPGPQEENPQASNPTPHASEKTRGVRPPRGDVSQILHGAAKKAARSNSRSDVHEYMRLRRNYV
ncbi:MAG: hypothetical protein OEV87_08200 [Phycisphaerae bacterium]|nr:hypothetical protein [Phycisphaerae bacterium]